MEWAVPVAALALVAAGYLAANRGHGKQAKFKLAQQLARDLTDVIARTFAVQPCFRCQEFSMRLLEISPNSRSVHYACLHCRKRMRSAAATPDAEAARPLLDRFVAAAEAYNAVAGDDEPLAVEIDFDTPMAPLPFEQTTRTNIPEAVRSEVWRRDSGRCVACGSNQNLQFDHVIPVSLGGATSVANIQLLCQPCNGAKGRRI